ncbi:MAG: membrane protein insertase YidC, partial [Candidatus Kapaibacterium sp.]
LKGTASTVIRGRIDLGNGSTLERTLTFNADSYVIDAGFTMSNLDNVMPSTQRWFDIAWERGLQYQEANSVDESNGAVAFASMNGSLEELDAPNYNEPVSSHQSGKVDFIGTKTKYFSVALLNPNSQGDDTYYLDGVRYGAPDNGVVEEYSFSMRVPYRGGVQTSNYRLYLGPLDYDIVKEYGMASTVNFGWKWLVRPIGEFFMLPVFTTIYRFLPNFGVAIIVFSLLMKLLLYPLSVGQIKSSQKMKVLQPEIDKLRKRFADDPTGMQQAQMKLFSEYGINPMGGCLPLLLQMPILYALYSVLTSNIHMRQAMFVQGWIPDLSVPDHILVLPFSILGIHALSGMALIMGVTMLIQQRMTITDPSQKAMVYMMPVMMTLMF